MDWIYSTKYCQDNGFRMASLDSQSEFDSFVKTFIKYSNQFEEFTHLGARTPFPGNKTEWFWLSSGQKVKFPIKWGANQPQSRNSGKLEECLAIRKIWKDYEFHDVDCYADAFKYLCHNITLL